MISRFMRVIACSIGTGPALGPLDHPGLSELGL
jgi:hypothetical protein